MAQQKTDAVKFGEHVSELFKLFNKADRKKLESALKSNDFTGLCKALGINENELKSLLGKGSKLAKGLFRSFLKEAASAFKKSTKV